MRGDKKKEKEAEVQKDTRQFNVNSKTHAKDYRLWRNAPRKKKPNICLPHETIDNL